ncbi:MAG: hypothetical protein WAT39_06745 [Planctomycetota bacterium]
MIRCLPAVLLSAFLSAQTQSPPPAPAAGPKVEVPTFANPTCPIMGKKVSMPLFVDTELGRFYLCCKPCNKKVLANVPAAHQTAYPVVQELKNTTCPVSGEAVGELAVDVTLQGFRFKVCCEGCVAGARQHSQVTLTKVNRTGTEDVGNATCPLAGTPVAANAFALIGDAIVHLSDAKLAEQVAKDPAAVLAKARAIAKAQPPRSRHEHQQPKQGAPKTEPGKDAGKEGK